ncbi:MAG: C39 family peptidase [Candidatus Woesearchaeota archaeon]
MNLRILDVPELRQPIYSPQCGPTCMAMVMQYHGVDTTRKEIVDNIHMLDTGIYPQQVGTYMMKRGFDVEFVLCNPHIFTLRDNDRSIESLIKKFERRLSSDKYAYKDAVSLMKYLDFCYAGGIINVKIPDYSDLESEIIGGRPVIANVTTRFHKAKHPRFNHHYVVVTGVDGKNVYVNDPSWHKVRGGKQKYTIDEFLFAIHATTEYCMSSGGILKIKPA